MRFFHSFQIFGVSMSPNFTNSEVVLTTNLFSNSASRGDVFIVQNPTDATRDAIRRIIGIPGDTIMLNNGSVYLNGKILDESKYISPDIKTYSAGNMRDGKPISVPQNSYFVLGDNRADSEDSRQWGFVPKSDIIGKVLFCYQNCSH